MHVNKRVDKRRRKNQTLLNEQKISNRSFERRQVEVETWAVKVNKQIESKKNKLITLYGSLDGADELMKRSLGTDFLPQRSKRSHINPSLDDSEIKLSEDMSHYSEISNRHEKRNNGYLKNEGRNHIIYEHRLHMGSKDKNKSIDKVNTSKDTDKIMHNKDLSFSTKGPILATGDPIPIPDEDFDSDIGRKSEILPYTKRLDRNERETKGIELKEFLKNKITESQKIRENRNEADQDDLVAFPSDDEISKKQKKDAIKDMNLVESDSN